MCGTQAVSLDFEKARSGASLFPGSDRQKQRARATSLISMYLYILSCSLIKVIVNAFLEHYGYSMARGEEEENYDCIAKRWDQASDPNRLQHRQSQGPRTLNEMDIATCAVRIYCLLRLEDVRFGLRHWEEFVPRNITPGRDHFQRVPQL